MTGQEIWTIVGDPLAHGHAPQVDELSPEDVKPRGDEHVLSAPAPGYHATSPFHFGARICEGQVELNGSSLGAGRQIRAKVGEDFVKAGEPLRGTIQGPVPVEGIIETVGPDTSPLFREPERSLRIRHPPPDPLVLLQR